MSSGPRDPIRFPRGWSQVATYVSEARKQGITTFVWDNGGDFMLFDRDNLNWRFLSIKEAVVGASEADQVPAQTIQVVKDSAPVDTYDISLAPGDGHRIMPLSATQELLHGIALLGFVG